MLKIGEVITKYAEDADALPQHPRPMSAGPQSYAPGPIGESAHDDDARRWREEGRMTKSVRESYGRPPYVSASGERSAAHIPPSHDYSRSYYPSDYPSIPHRRTSEAELMHRSGPRDVPDMHTRRGDHGQHSAPPVSPPHQDIHDDPHDDLVVKRKRRAPIDLDDSMKHSSSPRPNIDTTRPSAFKAKSNKRIRINWSQAENQVFFDTIQKFSTEDEGVVLKEIVTALNGSRNWVQCKGHFRNLQYVGRISQTDTNPKRWIVEQGKSPKPTGSVSKPSSSTGEKNPDSPNDETQPSQAKFGHNGALQQPMVDFDQHNASAPDVTTAPTNAEDKSQTERDQMTMHGENDDDNGDVDEQDDDYQSINKHNEDRVDNNNNSNGHVSRRNTKSLRGMPNAVTQIQSHDNIHPSNVASSSTSRVDDVADHDAERDLRHANQTVRRQSYDLRRDIAMPLKKQTSSTSVPSNPMLHHLRPRENREKRR